MGRARRIQIPGVPFHVVQRGHDRDRVFFDDDDRRAFLFLLIRFCRRHEARIHAFVLMTNHVHLLMTSDQPDGISRTMHGVTSVYARRINERHERTGAFWERRFSASPIDTDFYCLACYRYIELNPVRAGIVASPADYRWSSFHENVGRRALSVVTPHESYLALGRTPQERQACYREIIGERLAERAVDMLREGAQRNAPVGRDGFVRSIEQETGLRFRPGRRGRPRTTD